MLLAAHQPTFSQTGEREPRLSRQTLHEREPPALRPVSAQRCMHSISAHPILTPPNASKENYSYSPCTNKCALVRIREATCTWPALECEQQDSLRSYPWSQYPQICKGQIWVAARARMFTHTHAAFTVFVLGQYKCPGAIVLIATCSPAPYQNIANLNTPQTLIDWHPIFFTKSFNSCKDIISVTSLFKCVMGSRCLSDLIATCPFKTSMSRLHFNI